MGVEPHLRGDASVLRVAGLQVVLALALLVILGVALVPWDAGAGTASVAVEDLFTPEQVAAAEEYSTEARAWSWSALGASLVVAAVLGLTRRGRTALGRVPGPWWVRTPVVVVLFVSVQAFVSLPFRLGGWRLRRDVGLSTQGWSGFLRDTALSSALDGLVLAVGLMTLVALARRVPRTWPVVTGGLAAAAVVVTSFLYPRFVEPLFHDFTPLPPGELRDGVAGMLAAEELAVNDIVVADASRRTTSLNAWVSGFGQTRRVVLYDTLAKEVPTDETLVVVAHELAHVQHRDVILGTTLGAVGAVMAVGALGLVLSSRRTREGVVDSVPILLAALTFGTQAVAPIENGISRAIESRADVTALCLNGDPEAFVRVQVKLAVRSLADPTPPRWSQWWWGSHPPVVDRVGLSGSGCG